MLINVTIEGISPLLMHKMNDAALEDGAKTALRGEKLGRRETAEQVAYKLPDGTLYIPYEWVVGAMTEAGRNIKLGKKQISTASSSLVPAAIHPTETEFSLGTKHFEVDTRPVKIPATGGRVLRHRPRLDKWKTSFTLDVEDDIFAAQTVRQLLDDAGKRIGIGDFRPAKRGPFGRFVVTAWKVQAAAEPTAA